MLSERNMLIHLIRHAKTVDDSEGLMQNIDAVIASSPDSQIQKLKEKLGTVKFDAIYSSPQKRAVQTAGLLFNSSDVEILDYIHEYVRPNFLNGARREQAVDFWENANKENKYGADWKYDGSESFSDIAKRADKFLDLLLQRGNGSQVAVIGHGVFFRHLIGMALMGEAYDPRIFFDFLLKVKIGNCGYIKIDIDNERRRVRSLEIINV
jgi:alpha-ribazole phosphatase